MFDDDFKGDYASTSACTELWLLLYTAVSRVQRASVRRVFRLAALSAGVRRREPLQVQSQQQLMQ